MTPQPLAQPFAQQGQSVHQHPASIDAYIRHGFSLVPIPPGTKGPRQPGWNQRGNALKSQADLPPGYGIGLAHAYSGTMALDIDDWELAVTSLAEDGIDLLKLYDAPDAVVIDSGRQGHGKLLYAMPFGLTMPSKKIQIGGTTVYELRCATSNGLTLQDILPPTIHVSTGQPYRWAGKGHWQRLPPLPAEVFKLWQSIIEDNQEQPTDTPISSTWDEIQTALDFIDASCSREHWIQVGMALHHYASEKGQLDEGFLVWNKWSMTSSKWPGDREVAQQWHSFKSNKSSSIRLGTLFKLASDAGWTRPPLDASQLFANVELASPSAVLEGMSPLTPWLDFTLLPPVLARRAEEVARSVGGNELIALWAGLGAVCGAIDARSRLRLMDDYEVPPVLWLMTIGEPSSKKTPSMRPMLKVLRQIEADDAPRFAKARGDWEFVEMVHAGKVKARAKFADSPEALLPGAVAPEASVLPPPPVPLRMVINDVTSQELVYMCAHRPHGLLAEMDELANWMRAMMDKHSSENRSAWVKSYDCDRYQVDRVGTKHTVVDNFAVSIVGNIQPKVFKGAVNDLAKDGLLQRFLFAIVPNVAPEMSQPIPEYLTNARQWEQTIRVIQALPPMTYTLSPEAFKLFRQYQSWTIQENKDERLVGDCDEFMTALGKMDGVCGRLALILHVIENPFSTVVSGDTMSKTIEMMQTYIIPSLRYALVEIGGMSPLAKWLYEWVLFHSDKDELTLSEIKRAARRQLPEETTSPHTIDRMVINAMYPLEVGGWTARLDDGAQEARHIARWAVNPQIRVKWAKERQEVADVRVRREADFRRRAEAYLAKMAAKKAAKGQ